MKILVFLYPYEEAKQFNEYFKQFAKKVLIPMIFGQYSEDECLYVSTDDEDEAKKLFEEIKECEAIITPSDFVEIWFVADRFGIKNIWQYNVWEENEEIRMQANRMGVYHRKLKFGVDTYAKPYSGRITW